MESRRDPRGTADGIASPVERPAPLTLRFKDAALEAGFEREYRQGATPYFRMLAAALLGFMVILSLTGLVVEFSVNQQGIQQLLWFALIPLTALALVALHVGPGSARPQAVMVGYVLAAAAVCIGYPRFFGDPYVASNYGYSYTAFLLFLVFALSRLAPVNALLLGAAVLGAYATLLAPLVGRDVLGHLSLLLGVAALGFGLGYLAELNIRTGYAMRAALARSETRLREEVEKSESLLLSLLPPRIAERLKQENRSIADGIVECTVLHCELVGFDALARELGPRGLLALLNRLFSRFDELCERHGLEKIKTMGDAYMAAAGVPDYREDHAEAAAALALAMMRSIAEFEAPARLELRIGIDSGPVIAGIIGTRRFSYDLWGETVNGAASMCAEGLSGRVQVTEAAARLMRRTHRLDARGDIEVRSRGRMRTYWLVDPEGSAAAEQDVDSDEPVEPYVFISYKREDLARIRPVLERVRALGHRVWIDRGIPGGAEWDAMLEERMRHCSLAVFFLSRASVASKFCRREVKFLDQLDKPIVSVRLEPADLAHGLDMLLSRYQIIDAGSPQFDAELERALRHGAVVR